LVSVVDFLTMLKRMSRSLEESNDADMANLENENEFSGGTCKDFCIARSASCNISGVASVDRQMSDKAVQIIEEFSRGAEMRYSNNLRLVSFGAIKTNFGMICQRKSVSGI
jgi:hypothetical protein